MTLVVGTDIPTGDEVKIYSGGEIKNKEELTEVSGIITLSKNAEFGSVYVTDVDGAPTSQMKELQTDGVTPATETTGTKKVRTSTAGSATYYAYYIDNETTGLTQIAACRDIKSPLGIDTMEIEIHGTGSKLKKTGATERTADLEELDYNDTFISTIFGDSVTGSPAAGDTKFITKYTGTRKIAAIVGKQYQAAVLKRKWFLVGCQVTKIDGSFPAENYYARSMSFLVDYMQAVIV